MKFSFSFILLAAASSSTLSAVASRDAEGSLRRRAVAGTDNRSPVQEHRAASSAVVISGVTNPVHAQLLASIAKQLAAGTGKAPGTSPHSPPLAEYAVSCGFLDFSCYECSLCQDIFQALVDTGSDALCDAACVGIVEAAGGGPEDPVADAVAIECVPLCGDIFSAAGDATAGSVCSAVGLC